MNKYFFTSLIFGSVIGALYYMKNNLTIKVVRYITDNNKTIGKMYLNDEYFCDTLEDVYRGQDVSDIIKVYGDTAIPNGNYKCKLTFSNKFQNYYPELFNVPNFTGVRIHTGSSTRDTEGCILVGDYSNGKWSANGSYVQKLRAIMPQFMFCNCKIEMI